MRTHAYVWWHKLLTHQSKHLGLGPKEYIWRYAIPRVMRLNIPSVYTWMHHVRTWWVQEDRGDVKRRKRAPRLTIYQKVKIVDYAVALVAEKKQTKFAVSRKRQNSKKKSPCDQGNRQQRAYRVKGLNLQRVCEKQFPELQGVKVCQLMMQCEKHSWRSLSIQQQKRYYQIPDTLKAALGMTTTLRGWRSLGPDGIQKVAEEKGVVNRWAVPSPVLQERAMEHWKHWHELSICVCAYTLYVYTCMYIIILRSDDLGFNKYVNVFIIQQYSMYTLACIRKSPNSCGTRWFTVRSWTSASKSSQLGTR